jgi:hypothetical protein
VRKSRAPWIVSVRLRGLQTSLSASRNIDPSIANRGELQGEHKGRLELTIKKQEKDILAAVDAIYMIILLAAALALVQGSTG